MDWVTRSPLLQRALQLLLPLRSAIRRASLPACLARVSWPVNRNGHLPAGFASGQEPRGPDWGSRRI